MPPKPAGAQWLKEKYQLNQFRLTHCSYIGNNESVELTNLGNVEQVYGPRYAPLNDVFTSHLEFYLKYDDINLDFLKAVFVKIDAKELFDYINKNPTKKYSRKIGFLYEFLLGEVPLSPKIKGVYIDLLEETEYITGTGSRNKKWKIIDNLLGDRNFCPIVRKTNRLASLLQIDISNKIQELEKKYPKDIFRRAAGYLYKKETKSSFEIEHEKPSAVRMDKFVQLLMKAGEEDTQKILDKDRLVTLQNAIVDPRFAVADIRNFQNYVGESLPNGNDLIHFICPPPKMVASMMDGLKACAAKTEGAVNAAIRSALIAFGFVFIHPFEDGNGRIHRFLIHDILVHDKLVPHGIIIPVSAHMLNHIRDYDNILEKYSKPLMQRVRYEKKDSGAIIVTNPEEIASYFNYPDLTDHCIYLLETLHATLEQDMPEELTFLQRYDEAKKELQSIVDMPDREINNMLVFLHQNNGVFPKRRRDSFAKLTEEEIEQMQQAYRMVYEI